MMNTIQCVRYRTDLLTWFASKDNSEKLEFVWLGQAGFVFRSGGVMAGIDPYLSNSLGEKYKGTRFPHVRMIEPPCRPESLASLDVLLSTHGHSDHMDPGTLGPLYRRESPTPLFLCPRSEAGKALERGVPLSRTAALNAGESWTLSKTPGSGKSAVSVSAIPAAHETVERDQQGNYRFLGYLIEIGGFRLFHSGDSIPYAGLIEQLRGMHIDIAFLPVNGRDAYRTGHGIAGNFTMQEAAAAARDADIPLLVPHHFGMFSFNTVSPEEIEAQIPADAPRVVIPELSAAYQADKYQAVKEEGQSDAR